MGLLKLKPAKHFEKQGYEGENWGSIGPLKELFLQVIELPQTKDGLYKIRLAGTAEIFEDSGKSLVKTSLSPDFCGAHTGQKCWTFINGWSFVRNLRAISDTDTPVEIVCDGIRTGFTLFGKLHWNDKYPTLFNSFEQFMFYWKEIEYQMNIENKKLQYC